MSDATNTLRTRVALYIRVSTEEQVGGFGLKMQKDGLLEHVHRNDYRGWYTELEWCFIEQGSGADSERDELKRLMEMAKKKEFDLVLVWKIDRISRSLSHLLTIFDELHQYGVGFASLKENIDFTGPIGKLIFHFFGAIAEFEREVIKMRTEEGKLTSAREGNYVGGGVPYGYDTVPNASGKGCKLVLVPEEAKIVEEIFQRFVYQGHTFSEIARDFNARCLKKGRSSRATARHKPWTENTIRDIIKNDIYTGVYVPNRYKQVSKKPKRYKERPKEEWIIKEVPACIDPLLFKQAQERLTSSDRKGGGGRELYMLAGKLVDVTTRKGFVGYLSSKGTKNYRRKKFLDKSGTMHRTISLAATELEKFAWDYVRVAIDDPSLFLRIHASGQKVHQERVALERELQIYQDSCSQLNEKIETVNKDLYDKRILQEERNALRGEYVAQRDQAYEKVKALEVGLEKLLKYEGACEDVRIFSERMQRRIKDFSYEDKCDLIRLLVEKVEILSGDEDRRAKVFFRFDQRAIVRANSEVRSILQEKVEEKPSFSQAVVGAEGFEPPTLSV